MRICMSLVGNKVNLRIPILLSHERKYVKTNTKSNLGKFIDFK